MAGIKIVDLPPLGRDLASTDLLELSLAGGTGSRKITGQEIMNASKLSINNTPIINGTVGRVLFQGTGNVLQQSSSLFWDEANNRLGIGTSSPDSKLYLDGGIFTKKYYTNTGSQTINFASAFELFGTPHSSGGFTFFINPSNWAGGWDLRIGDSTNSILFNRSSGITVNKVNSDELSLGGGGTLTYYRVSPATGFSYNSASGWDFVLRGTSDEKLRVKGNTGNVLINTTTDAGFRLDVNGTARVSGALTASSLINIVSGSTTLDRDGVFLRVHGTSGIKLTTWNAGYVDALTVQATTGNVGIGTSSPVSRLHIGTSVGSLATGLTFGSGVSGIWLLDNTTMGIKINSVDKFWFRATDFYPDASLSLELGLSSRRWKSLYTQQITDNGSNVLIGTTTDAGYKLDVNGTARVQGTLTLGNSGSSGFYIPNTNRLAFFTNGVDRGRFWEDGNFSINSLANNGFRFECVGTARITSTLKLGASTAQTVSAVLDVDSTTKGFLPPRMTQAQRNAIASPAIGLEIYQTDATEGKYIYKSSGWTYIG